MGKIGYGYGSEWHLLRHLGYHRDYLSQKVLGSVGGNALKFEDFEFSTENAPLKDDKEFIGLEFVQGEHIQEKWKSFWPQTGNVQNWDAIGQVYFDNKYEWLLVEAKGHIGEIKSTCGATNPKSKQKIYSALEKTSKAFGNQSKPIDNWLTPYYQYANRLAVLYFLLKECNPPVKARLLFIYFYGDSRIDAECPQSEQEWLPAIQSMSDWLGIDKSSELSQQVHYLFLPINPAGNGVRLPAKCG